MGDVEKCCMCISWMQRDLLVDKRETRDPVAPDEKLGFVCVMTAWGSNTDTSNSTVISFSLLSAGLILQGACGNLPFKLCFSSPGYLVSMVK